MFIPCTSGRVRNFERVVSFAVNLSVLNAERSTTLTRLISTKSITDRRALSRTYKEALSMY